jgi:hypothetical protein
VEAWAELHREELLKDWELLQSGQAPMKIAPPLEGELFGPLQNPNMFNAVSLDKDIGTVTWPNGADFDPTTLHDWPQVRDELVGMARGWAERESSPGRAAR